MRVRRKLAAGGGDPARKPQPSVQDSGFSTETSCGKDASASASARRPLEDELWALLDVIQRKGVRLRDEAELLRGELDERPADTAEESFARVLSAGGCGDCADLRRLRGERDALLERAAQLEAEACANHVTTLHVSFVRTTYLIPPNFLHYHGGFFVCGVRVRFQFPLKCSGDPLLISRF